MLSTPYTAARGLDDAPGGPMPGDDPDDPRGPEDSPHYSKKELYRAPPLGPVDAEREMAPGSGQSASGSERPTVPEPAYIDTSRRQRPQRDVDASKINQLMAGLGALGTIAAGDERTTLSAIGAGLADAGATRQEQQDKRYREDLRGYQQWLADARKRNSLLRKGYRQRQYEAERSDYEAEREAERTRRQNKREHSRRMEEIGAEQNNAYNEARADAQEALAEKRRAGAEENRAQAQYYEERDRGGGGGGESDEQVTPDERDAYREAQYDLQKLHDRARALKEDIERLENADVSPANAAGSMEEAKRKRQAKIQDKKAELREVNTERNRVNERLIDMTRRNPGLGGRGGAQARGRGRASAEQESPDGSGRQQQQQQQQRAEKPPLEAVNEVLQQRGRETLSEQEYKVLSVGDLKRAGLLE
jgi:hypothetical protein